MSSEQGPSLFEQGLNKAQDLWNKVWTPPEVDIPVYEDSQANRNTLNDEINKKLNDVGIFPSGGKPSPATIAKAKKELDGPGPSSKPSPATVIKTGAQPGEKNPETMAGSEAYKASIEEMIGQNKEQTFQDPAGGADIQIVAIRKTDEYDRTHSYFVYQAIKGDSVWDPVNRDWKKAPAETNQKLQIDGGDYTGKTVDGKPEGKGTFKKYGVTWEGEWENGVLKDGGKYTDKLGNTFEGSFYANKGMKKGIIIKLNDPNVVKYDCEFDENGQRNGKFRFEYNGGTSLSCNYEAGVLNGTYVLNYSNGDIQEGTYKNGKKNGPATYINYAEEKTYNEIWENDVLVKQEEIIT